MYTCIIIDDERYAIDGLMKYIEAIPYLKVINSFTDPLEALRSIKVGEDVDIMFLDIDMPRLNGIELAREIRHKTKKLIMTSGHREYGYDAFEIKADKFLLKPYSLGKFIAAIEDLFAPPPDIEEKIQTEDEVTEDFLFVKNKIENHRLNRVKHVDIIVVESNSNDVKIVMKNSDQIVSCLSLLRLANQLNEKTGFMRVHRSYIINLKEIISYKENKVQLMGNLEIPVGAKYRKQFNQYMKNHFKRG